MLQAHFTDQLKIHVTCKNFESRDRKNIENSTFSDLGRSMKFDQECEFENKESWPTWFILAVKT